MLPITHAQQTGAIRILTMRHGHTLQPAKQHRAGIVNAIYVDPATTQVVAELRTQNGQPHYTCIYTERRIVPSLPNDIIETLGADRIEKSIP